MTIDINKIVMESINSVQDDQTVLAESHEIDDSENVNTNLQSHDSDQMTENIMDSALASALSAGLGAVTLRNRLKSISEVEIDDVVDKAQELGGKAASKFSDFATSGAGKATGGAAAGAGGALAAKKIRDRMKRNKQSK